MMISNYHAFTWCVILPCAPNVHNISLDNVFPTHLLPCWMTSAFTSSHALRRNWTPGLLSSSLSSKVHGSWRLASRFNFFDYFSRLNPLSSLQRTYSPRNNPIYSAVLLGAAIVFKTTVWKAQCAVLLGLDWSMYNFGLYSLPTRSR